MTVTLILIIILGLVAGSFINALVWRFHEQAEAREKGKSPERSLSILHGRSMCPSCRHQLAALDLIPVISWLSLAGRCRYCQAKIGWRYPGVELLAALLFGWSYLALQPSSAGSWVCLIGWFYVLICLLALAIYDLQWMLLPNAIILAGIMGVLALVLVQWLGFGLSLGFVERHLLAGLLLGAGFYVLAALAGGKLFGGGDVKLGVLMGLLLGLRGTLVALVVAFDTAAIIGLVLIGLRRRTRKDYLPFGPFLVLGTIVAFLYGHNLVAWYLHLNGLNS